MNRKVIYQNGKKIIIEREGNFDYLKESEKEFKERVSDGRYKFLSRERVVPNKKHYNRKEKHKSLIY